MIALLLRRRQALGRCARSQDLDFDEAVRRALAGESPGQSPPPLRGDGDTASAGRGGDGRGSRGGDGGGAEEESKADAKGRSGGDADGGGDGRRGSIGAADEKVRAAALDYAWFWFRLSVSRAGVVQSALRFRAWVWACGARATEIAVTLRWLVAVDVAV